MPGFFRFSGDRLRAIRTQHEMSRELLAVMAGVSYKSVYAYESGVRTPTRNTLARLANALGVSPAALVEDDPTMAVAER